MLALVLLSVFLSCLAIGISMSVWIEFHNFNDNF